MQILVAVVVVVVVAVVVAVVAFELVALAVVGEPHAVQKCGLVFAVVDGEAVVAVELAVVVAAVVVVVAAGNVNAAAAGGVVTVVVDVAAVVVLVVVSVPVWVHVAVLAVAAFAGPAVVEFGDDASS